MVAGCPAKGATPESCRPRPDLALVVFCLRLDPGSVPAPRGLCRLLGRVASTSAAHLSAMRSSAEELYGSSRPLARLLPELHSGAAGGRWRDGGVRVRRPGPDVPAARQAAEPWRNPGPTRRTSGPGGGRYGFLPRLQRAGADPLTSRLEPTTRLCACDGAGAATGASDRVEATADPDPSSDPCHRCKTARPPRPRHPGAVGVPLPAPDRRRACLARRRRHDHGNDDRRLRSRAEGRRRNRNPGRRMGPGAPRQTPAPI